MNLGTQAALGLLACLAGWVAAFQISATVPGMSLDKFRPMLESAGAAALCAALPMLPDLLADEPVVTPRQIARAALAAACGVFLLFRRTPSKPAEPK